MFSGKVFSYLMVNPVHIIICMALHNSCIIHTVMSRESVEKVGDILTFPMLEKVWEGGQIKFSIVHRCILKKHCLFAITIHNSTDF